MSIRHLSPNQAEPNRTAPGPEPNVMEIRAARVTDRVWSSILDARDKAATGSPQQWSGEERAAWQLYAPLLDPPRPIVFAQVGQSLDGRVATPQGDAAQVSGLEGLRHLHRCRALADAVIIGVRTALLDDPRLTVRLVAGPNPARVVIDPQGRLPDDAVLLGQNGPRRLLVQSCARRRGSDVETIELPLLPGGISPQAIVSRLVELGFRRILVEGGATTIGRFLDAGCVDRLHIAVSPMIIGSGPPGLKTAPVARLSQARRPRTWGYGLGTDIVFDCALDHGPFPGNASTST